MSLGEIMEYLNARKRLTRYSVFGAQVAALVLLVASCGGGGDGPTAPTFTIGQSYGGGTVFFVDGTAQHGLIAPTSDQSAGADWGCKGTSLTGASGTAVGTGAQNTIDVANGCSTAGIAARICDQLVLNGSSDWFLPSQDEVNLLYAQRNMLGGFDVSGLHFYWSSTEVDATTARGHDATYFKDQQTFGGSLLGRVRCVRAF
jgi:hypothetical protein